MDKLGVEQVSEAGGEQRKREKTGYKVILFATTTLAVKGFMVLTNVMPKKKRNHPQIFSVVEESGPNVQSSKLAFHHGPKPDRVGSGY